MSKDLVTYHGQTTLIDNFVDKYGTCLEDIEREIKLLLRVVLSTYVLNPDKSLISIQKDFLVNTAKPPKLFDVCLDLEGITINEAETLLNAIQHQLNWGNARLKQ